MAAYFLVGFLLILRDALKKLRELRLQNIRRSPVAHKVQTGNQLKRPDFKPAHEGAADHDGDNDNQGKQRDYADLFVNLFPFFLIHLFPFCRLSAAIY